MLYETEKHLQKQNAGTSYFFSQGLQNGKMLLYSPDSSGNPFWAGVQRKKIAAYSGTMLPDKAL